MTVTFQKEGGVLLVLPVGRLDSVHSPVFERQLEPEMDGITHLTIDFEKVEYISSGGLRVLLEVQREMEDRAGTFRLIHVSGPIMEILNMVGFLDFITVE